MSVIEIEAVNKRLPTRFPPSLHQAMTEQEFQSIITDTNEGRLQWLQAFSVPIVSTTLTMYQCWSRA